jgi:hypothetical protein
MTAMLGIFGAANVSGRFHFARFVLQMKVCASAASPLDLTVSERRPRGQKQISSKKESDRLDHDSVKDPVCFL